MMDVEGLIRHLAEVDDGPFGVLSLQASPVTAALARAFPGRLKALFSAEHGFFGLAGPGEETGSLWHPFWNVPCHSLYGKTRKPTAEMTEGLKRLVVDLPDVGVRCYTYLATLKLTLEACAEQGIPVTVLDRPTPLGGVLDGPRLDAGFESFVAPIDVPLCHGMTFGELAVFIVREGRLDLDLTVVPMRRWRHTVRVPWPNFTQPSPGIPSWDSAALYPATVFTEAYPALDCDRGGPLSFRVLGAPWLDARHLLEDLSAGVTACGLGIRPFRYRPAHGRYAKSAIDGVLLSIDNPEAFYPVTAGVLLLAGVLVRHSSHMAAGARPEWLAKLMGTDSVLRAIENDDLGGLFASWIEGQDEYLPRRVDNYRS